MLHLFKDIMLVLQLTCNGLQIAQMGDSNPLLPPQTKFLKVMFLHLSVRKLHEIERNCTEKGSAHP